MLGSRERAHMLAPVRSRTQGADMRRLLVVVRVRRCCWREPAARRMLRPARRRPPPARLAAASASPSSSDAQLPRRHQPRRTPECLNGRYRLVRFVGVGEKGTYGTGEGGDVTSHLRQRDRTCCAAQARTDQANTGRTDGRPTGGRHDQRRLSRGGRQGDLHGRAKAPARPRWSVGPVEADRDDGRRSATCSLPTARPD